LLLKGRKEADDGCSKQAVNQTDSYTFEDQTEKGQVLTMQSNAKKKKREGALTGEGRGQGSFPRRAGLLLSPNVQEKGNSAGLITT